MSINHLPVKRIVRYNNWEYKLGSTSGRPGRRWGQPSDQLGFPPDIKSGVFSGNDNYWSHGQEFALNPNFELTLTPSVNWTVFRPNPFMEWTVHRQSQNSSTRPPQNDIHGPASEFVHEMDGLRTNFGPLSTWTDGQVDSPQTAVFVHGGLD